MIIIRLTLMIVPSIRIPLYLPFRMFLSHDRLRIWWIINNKNITLPIYSWISSPTNTYAIRTESSIVIQISIIISEMFIFCGQYFNFHQQRNIQLSRTYAAAVSAPRAGNPQILHKQKCCLIQQLLFIGR